MELSNITLNSFSFEKKQRLLNKSDFSGFKRTPLIRSQYFIVLVKSQSLDNARLGLAISKKIGNAVRRNLIKRLIREHFRKSNFKNLPVDVFFAINSSISLKNINISYQSLKNDLNTLFTQLELSLGNSIGRLE